MAGPKVQFKLTVKDRFTCPDVEYSAATANLFKPTYLSGQIIFVEDSGQIFLDFHNWRRCYSISKQERADGIRYLGISSTDPSTGVATVDGIAVTPKTGDMVVYGTKEFIYRKGTDEQFRWYEFGDEDAPEWDNDSNSWSES